MNRLRGTRLQRVKGYHPTTTASMAVPLQVPPCVNVIWQHAWSEERLELVFGETGLTDDGFQCAARQLTRVHWNRDQGLTVGVPQKTMAASLASLFKACLLQGSGGLARGEGGKPAHAAAGDLTWMSMSTGAVTSSEGIGLPSSARTSRYPSMAS